MPFTYFGPLFCSAPQPAPPTLHLRKSLQRQYLGSEASEQDLFSRVQRKLAGRKTSEVSENIVFVLTVPFLFFDLCALFHCIRRKSKRRRCLNWLRRLPRG